MKQALIFMFSIYFLSSNVIGKEIQRDIIFKDLGVKIVFDITKGPVVLEETIGDLYLFDIETNSKIAFPEKDKALNVEVISKDTENLSPKPMVHLNYKSEDDRKLSRIFFTAGGKWEMKFDFKYKGKEESQSIYFDLKNDRDFPKNTESFPYVGKKAHNLVGILGGTGCRRRWDFVDTHDSLHMNMPYDLCGKYAMVSTRYHKWIDMSLDGDKVEKLQLSPLKGDAVLEKLTCNSDKNFYKLVHFPECGGEGKVISYCDKSGNQIDPGNIGCY